MQHQQASEDEMKPNRRRRTCSTEPRTATGTATATGPRRSITHTGSTTRTHGMTTFNSRSTIVWCLMSLIGVCFFQHGNVSGNGNGGGVTFALALTSSSPFVRHVSMQTSRTITRAATVTTTSTAVTVDRKKVHMNVGSTPTSASASSSDLPGATATANSSGWRVALDIGRESFSTMPSSWAESGARFPLIVKFEFASNNDDNDNDNGNGNTVSAISGDARYTASQGEIVVPIEPGTWTLSDSDDDQKKNLSFSFHLPQTIERNGVQLGPCTLTCQTVVYTVKDIDALNREFYRVRSITDEANAQLQEMKRKKEAPKKWDFEEEKWVQRYEDESILGTLSKRMEQFKAERQERGRSKIRPKPSDLSLESGAFPGIDCNVYIGKRGTIRMHGDGGGFFGSDRGGVIGTFGAEPINDNPASYYRPSY